MAHSITSGVAERYASALFDLAKEGDALKPVERQLHGLKALLNESEDLRRLVRSPVFSTEDQMRGVDAVMRKFEVKGRVANFVRVVIRNRRLFVLPEMISAFEAMLAEHRGETIAEITSAEPLPEAQLDALREVLAEKAGGTVKLETHVDPSLIGGLIVKLGSQMIDTSVKTRLSGLRAAMKEAA